MQNKRSLVIVAFLLLIIVAIAKVTSPADCKQIFNRSALPESAPHLYKVKIERGHYRTISGGSRTYTLYLPQADATLPSGHYPVVVLLHGFLMTGAQHRNNADYFASHGVIALTPDLTKVLLGDDTRMRNVSDLLAEIKWLIEQSNATKGSLAGMVDPGRIGIAGNSAGGAACLELLLEAQKSGIPINTMCSLDGVPWDRSWHRLAQLEKVNILALRAEPGLCNYHSRMLQYLALLRFPFDDVKINGAHHCDVENPSTLGCHCICGTSNEKYRRIFQKLTYLYFRDKFQAPVFDDCKQSFVETVATLQSDGKVVADLNQTKHTEIASGQTVRPN